jgi:hypothetical protein
MRFARRVFLASGIYGLIAMTPLYVLEQQVGLDHPPAINHPEYYYGFAGVGIAWQLMFLVIGSDPFRYRMAMLPAVVEKVSFAIPIPILYALGRVPAAMVAFAAIDGFLAVLFVVAYLRTPAQGPPKNAPA